MPSPLLASSSPVLVNERGGPVAPSDILAALKRVAAPLSLRWIPDFDQSRWAITWEWPTTDPRWATVRSGDTDPQKAFDIIGYLPVKCSLPEAAGAVENHLKTYPVEAVSRTRENMAKWNDVTVPAEQTATVITDTLDDVSRASRAPKGLVVNLPQSARKLWSKR